MVNWCLRGLLVFAVAFSVFLIGALVTATGNDTYFSEYFLWLLGIIGFLAVVLAAWVVFLLVRMYWCLKTNKFGSRITAKYALSYAAIAIIPGVLIYLVSVQYMTRSIESWFNVKVDKALESGIELGQNLLDTQIADLKARANAINADLIGVSESKLLSTLLQSRDAMGTSADAMVFSFPGNRILAFTGGNFGRLLPSLPPVSVLNQVRVSREYARAEVVDGSDPNHPIMQIRVVLPVLSSSLGSEGSLGGASSESYWLQLTILIPQNLSDNLTQVQNGFRDYEELSISRHGMRKLFSVALTVVLMLTIFMAVSVALRMAKRLVEPLLQLAKGTHAVAKGQYELLPKAHSNDEVAQLTEDFNLMVNQLDEARQEVQTKQTQLEESNLHLESILESLSSGVIVFDSQMRVTIINRAAEVILEEDLSQLPGKPLTSLESISEFAKEVSLAFSIHKENDNHQPYWQEQIEIHGQQHASGVDKGIVLLMRGMQLVTTHDEIGYVLVFDDISSVIAANRVVAWGEVARRLAHEIKNPLTPIQLSAERISMKLESKLDEKDSEFLKRSIGTIVNQVSSLKQMVNDFRDYAKTPETTYQAVDLNALIVDVASLYGWDPKGHAGSDNPSAIMLDLDPHIPFVEGNENQLRQVLNNLLGNAKDALQNVVLSQEEAGIVIRTQLLQDEQRSVVKLVIDDVGEGFNPEFLDTAFEPYVTSKPTGTGLGLAIVKKIIEEHGGKVELCNRQVKGARVTILFLKLIKSV
ncbi:sensor histidine kinase [Basilea psittacipulmonis]|nr:ATP-binding protein [Basilea psittacipulmonis]